MASFWLDIFTNLAANFLFWLILGVLFFFGSLAVENRMVRFFGLSRERRVLLLLSNLAGPQADGKTRYYMSPHEFQATQSVNRLFGGAPLRLPELVRGLVDGVWLRRRVQCRVEVSEPNSSTADQINLAGSCIVVGGAARNALRRYALDNAVVRATLAGEAHPVQPVPAVGDEVTATIRLPDGNLQEITARKNLAVIEKVNQPDGYVNFFCHGVRADTSWIAVEYLVRNWKDLYKRFGSRDFVVVIGVPWNHAYYTEYSEPARLAAAATTPS